MSERSRSSLVGDVMSADVRSIGRMATVEDAIAAMREAGVSSLVVERRDAERRIRTDRHHRHRPRGDRQGPRRRPCQRLRGNVEAAADVPVDMQTKYAVRLLVRFNVSRALVVDDTRAPVGIVTLRDWCCASRACAD